MKRITLNIAEELYVALRERARETGVPQSEQIRRALEVAIVKPRRKLLARESERDVAISALLAREPELAVYFPGYLPEQKSSAEQPLFSEQLVQLDNDCPVRRLVKG